MRKYRGGGVVLVLALAACNTPPPRMWVRFEPAAASEWTNGAQGLLVGRLHGVDLTIDLNRVQTRVQVVAENRTAAAVELRVGADDSSPHGAIGEVLLRSLDGSTAGPDTMPYNSMQPQSLAAGWRATFYIDAPLGREVTVGQFFTLGIEARNSAGALQRRTLPLRAVNGGTVPADGR